MAKKHSESSIALASKTSVSPVQPTQNTSRRTPSKTKQTTKVNLTEPALISAALRHNMITEAAYYLAERRGFIPGHEIEDWLAAESAIDTNLEN